MEKNFYPSTRFDDILRDLMITIYDDFLKKNPHDDNFYYENTLLHAVAP